MRVKKAWLSPKEGYDMLNGDRIIDGTETPVSRKRREKCSFIT